MSSETRGAKRSPPPNPPASTQRTVADIVRKYAAAFREFGRRRMLRRADVYELDDEQSTATGPEQAHSTTSR